MRRLGDGETRGSRDSTMRLCSPLAVAPSPCLPFPSSLLNYASSGRLYKLDKVCYFLAIGNQFFDLLKGLGGI